MATTVFNVANHILKHERGFGLLQLIKLCYLSYGWYWTAANEKLFFENVEAWKYGPVIPELYFSLKHFSGQTLPANCLENLIIEDGTFSSDAKKLVDSVVDFYGQCSGVELSALTHKKGSPWHKTYKAGEAWVPIPDNIIKKHFDKLHRENSNN